MNSVSLLLVLFSFVQSQITDKWDECGCEWLDWESWSKCSKVCSGGTQIRSRKNRSYRTPGCDTFLSCSSSEMGWDYRYCNQFCSNGGTFIRPSTCDCSEKWQGYCNQCFYGTSRHGSCSCPLRWRGTCCDEEVTCGNPGSIPNGRVYGSVYHYGSTVTYTCNSNYEFASGTPVRRCTSDGYWSGRRPVCLFANTCQSNPCKNGGTCVNHIERYDCKCSSGWGGINCEIDIQPPLKRNCPNDITKYISERTVYINWTEPTFFDPMGTPLQISKNYPQNHWEFGWGSFIVQYVATKLVNGLRSECLFTIKIRPHSCSPLNVTEEHIAKVCTDWMTDYGQFCLVFCDKYFTLANENNFDQWYVCGASGQWFPYISLPKCNMPFDLAHINGRNYFHYESCNDSPSIDEMKGIFINRLNTSEFSSFCRRFDDKCSKDHVSVICK